MGFKEIALPLAKMGVPTTPVLPNSKKAFLPGWQQSATINEQQILAWDAAYPNYNGAAVARAEEGGVWFFEVDSPEVVQRIQAETGKEIPATYRVRSRPGRGHFYWRQTPASLAMGNIAQGYVKGGDWSARVNNEYVVAAGSIHPHSQQPYVALRDESIVPAPDWLIEWCVAQKITQQPNAPKTLERDAHGLVPHGSIHTYMLMEAGRLRNLGLSEDAIYTGLSELVHKNCAPPIDESRIKLMAKSICNFPEGQPPILFNQKPDAAPVTEIEIPDFAADPYPKFPKWVMEGTSLYEKFVKPVCANNSRIDYFMWIPAMQILLNYIGPKVKIKTGFGPRPFKGSIYTVIVGRKGKTNKSSSVGDAMNYFNYCGVLSHASRDMKNAEGRVVTWTAGSPEGLGLSMQKINCKNAILFYDELSQLVSKASIDSSTLASGLLTMYESGKFENSVKSTKETFSLDPDTYCTSLIACTTNSKFAELWSKLAGNDTGLDDRFMFVYQPDPLPEPRLQQFVNFAEGALVTKKLIDKAINQGEYAFDNDTPHPRLLELVKIENRYANRAEKWALALAIDLGLDSIDDECIERAVAIVEYEIAVKKYLKSYEATTREGQLQQEVRRVLELNKGRMLKRALIRALHADRHGTSLWTQAYVGLIKAGVIREEGTGDKGDPTHVQLLIKRDTEDDD